jgi:hypothetical protein
MRQLLVPVRGRLPLQTDCLMVPKALHLGPLPSQRVSCLELPGRLHLLPQKDCWRGLMEPEQRLMRMGWLPEQPKVREHRRWRQRGSLKLC